MEYRRVGRNNLSVSAVGFGCWAIGGQGWGDVDDRESMAAISRALELGVTLFDTADGYGVGHSEEVLGAALGARRHDVVIATKGGLDWGQFGEPRGEMHVGMAGRRFPGVVRNGTSRHIRAAVDASLRRLRTDYIDIYQIHWPDPRTPFSETASLLCDLVDEGKIRYVGVSNFSTVEMEEWLRFGPLHTLQPPYHLFDRHIEAEVLPFCQQRGIGLLAYAPLAHGLLTGKFSLDTVFSEKDFRSTHPMFEGHAFRANLARVDRLKAYATTRGRSLVELAIGWVLARDGVTSALVGAKRTVQVVENVRAAGNPLSAEEVSAIEDLIARAV